VATSAETPIFDNWTALSFKRAMGNRSTPGTSWMAPSWVSDHNRRLTAYIILQSYFDNSSRFFLESTDSTQYADDHREYGDAATLRDTILAALLGDDQTIQVEGADRDPEAEDTPEEDKAEIEEALVLQEWLEDWAWNQERFGLKMIETERNAVGLGDGVYVLGFSPDKGRVRLRVFDPGYYFPVLSDGNEDDYPPRIHIAWEIDQPDASKRVVRRITWELVDIEPTTRAYQDEPVNQTCLMTDATWTLDTGRPNTPDDLVGATAEYETYIDENGEAQEWRDLDLEIDFIPVIHMPNTVAIQNHYGKSSIERVLQILDDLSNADTDLQGASATTGKPPVAISSSVGATTRPTWKPGDLWTLGENGRATMIDTSKSLDALIGYVGHLMKRMDVSSRVPGAVLGRISPSDVPSGIALALSFGPLRSMIAEMRLVRDEKYPILLKFVWRMSMQAGVEDVPETWLPAKVEFGSFLPHDIAAVVSTVTELLKAKAIGRRTAIRLLVAAGIDIEDASAEVDAIAATDFDGAVKLADAVGSEEVAAEYLQTELPKPPPPVGAPVITPPAEVPPIAQPQPEELPTT
jgi:hypothetical protein